MQLHYAIVQVHYTYVLNLLVRNYMVSQQLVMVHLKEKEYSARI